MCAIPRCAIARTPTAVIRARPASSTTATASCWSGIATLRPATKSRKTSATPSRPAMPAVPGSSSSAPSITAKPGPRRSRSSSGTRHCPSTRNGRSCTGPTRQRWRASRLTSPAQTPRCTSRAPPPVRHRRLDESEVRKMAQEQGFRVESSHSLSDHHYMLIMRK